MGLKDVQQRRVKVDLGVMTLKGLSTLHWFSELEPYHRIHFYTVHRKMTLTANSCSFPTLYLIIYSKDFGILREKNWFYVLH